MKLVLLCFLLFPALLYAQGPDQDYIQIYNVIEQADALKQNGQTLAAAERYREAETALKKLQASYPQWNDNVIKFRLGYVADKLQSFTQNSETAPPVIARPVLVPRKTSAPVNPPNPSDQANEEVRRLQAEKNLLEAKLKEALAQQPGIGRSNDLAKIDEQMASLQKERDLLKVALEQQQKANKEQVSDAGIAELAKLKQLEQERDELQKKLALADVVSSKSTGGESDRAREVEQLRARLEALEAKPTPFTPEELALFRQPATQLAPLETKKKSKIVPPGAGALVARAEREFMAQQFADAEKTYREVLRQDEDNVYILGNLAATQLELNHLEEVEKILQRALTIEPDDAFSLTLLGMTRFREGKMDDALDLLSRSAKIDPQNPETQNYLGITLSQKGQRAAAEAALRKAIKIQPGYAGAHHNLAVIYATQRPPYMELAKWHYDHARALGHPQNPDLEKIINAEK